MINVLRQKFTSVLSPKALSIVQWLFWIRINYSFVIRDTKDFIQFESNIPCGLIRIGVDNYKRVGEFRERLRIIQYRDKLDSGEIGYFAENKDNIVGSIWATINRADRKSIVRSYMKLDCNEALIHDIVTKDSFRRKGVGPFMTTQLAFVLLKEFAVKNIIIDVNSKNISSLKMMEKIGLRRPEKAAYITTIGTLLFKIKLPDKRIA